MYLHEFIRRLIYTNIPKYTFVYRYNKPIIAKILKLFGVVPALFIIPLTSFLKTPYLNYL